MGSVNDKRHHQVISFDIAHQYFYLNAAHIVTAARLNQLTVDTVVVVLGMQF